MMKIRLIWDDTTSTRERRPDSLEELRKDIHIKEYTSKKGLLDALLDLADLDQTDLKEDSVEDQITEILNDLRDPGDGSPNVLYVSIDEKELPGTVSYPQLTGLDLEHCTKRDIVRALGGHIRSAFKIDDDWLVDYQGSDKDVEIPEGVYIIGTYAFADNKDLQSVILADSVGVVNDYAFSNCSNLTNIIASPNLTVISDSAFEDCLNLSDIRYTGTVEQWNSIKKGADWDKNTGNYIVHCTDGDIKKETSESLKKTATISESRKSFNDLNTDDARKLYESFRK